MKTLLLGLAIVLLTPLSAQAQERASQKVSFYGYQTIEVPATIYLRIGPEKFEKVVLPGANSTESYQVMNNRGGIGIFGAPVPNAEGKEVHPRLGFIKANSDWPKAFAILSSQKIDGQVRWAGHAFPLSDKDFPDGSLKLANLSPAAVRGKLGKQQVRIKPGEISTIRFEDPKGSLIDVIFQYKTKQKDSWARMIATRWPVPENGRRILFIFPDPNGKGIRSKTIPIRNDKRAEE